MFLYLVILVLYVINWKINSKCSRINCNLYNILHVCKAETKILITQGDSYEHYAWKKKLLLSNQTLLFNQTQCCSTGNEFNTWCRLWRRKQSREQRRDDDRKTAQRQTSVSSAITHHERYISSSSFEFWLPSDFAGLMRKCRVLTHRKERVGETRRIPRTAESGYHEYKRVKQA